MITILLKMNDHLPTYEIVMFIMPFSVFVVGQPSWLTNKGRLEQRLGAAETLIANGDDLTIGQLIALLQGRGGSSSSHLILKVQCHIAKLLLDVPHDLTLSCREEICQYHQKNPARHLWSDTHMNQTNELLNSWSVLENVCICLCLLLAPFFLF